MFIDPMMPPYMVGVILICYADARPAPVYFFQNMRTNEIYPGQELVIPETWNGYNQMVLCQAENTIEGINYSLNVHINVDLSRKCDFNMLNYPLPYFIHTYIYLYM